MSRRKESGLKKALFFSAASLVGPLPGDAQGYIAKKMGVERNSFTKYQILISCGVSALKLYLAEKGMDADNGLMNASGLGIGLWAGAIMVSNTARAAYTLCTKKPVGDLLSFEPAWQVIKRADGKGRISRMARRVVEPRMRKVFRKVGWDYDEFDDQYGSAA